MEKKASINKPLMIIAAVLSGVGAVCATICMITEHIYYIRWVCTVLATITISLFSFIAISTPKYNKCFIIPFVFYFLFPPLINYLDAGERYFINHSLKSFVHYFLFPLVLFAILTATVLINKIAIKIPACFLLLLYVYMPIRSLILFDGYTELYYYVTPLFIVAALIIIFALPKYEEVADANGSELFQPQNLALCIVLSIVTCGIYGLVWKYQLCRKIRLLNDESTDCVGEYLCLILVPFYHLYWYYTRGQKLYQGMKKVGAPASDNSVINLVLALFGFSIVSDALIQNDLNKAAGVLQVRSRTVSVEAENSVSSDEEDAVQTEESSADKAEPADENMALLQQLAELHDKGILSDEEFEAKKQDLLDRI